MKYIASYDIGTTAVKAVLVSVEGEATAQASRDIPTMYSGDKREQDPKVWWEAFCAISRELTAIVGSESIAGIVMSGQMQDVIPVDDNGEALCPAILYSDGRATVYAKRLNDELGADKLLRSTGNVCDGSIPIAKIMQLKAEEPEIYRKAASFLISSKDFVIRKLTGNNTGDHTACSTAGAMNLEKLEWDEEILGAAGVDAAKMPKLYASHEPVGTVTIDAARECAYLQGTPVFAGVGDAGATTLAAGIMRPGQFNINLGTSGWVAAISDGPYFNGAGVFNLAAMPINRVINVVPFLNAGNVHHWVSGLFSQDGVNPDYARTEAMLSASVPGANGVFALPYLVGERFPVLDPVSKGAYLGVTPETTPADMTRAMIEGVCFSIHDGIDQWDMTPEMISVIGGGGRSAAWCGILADILGSEVRVFDGSDTLPAKAVAAAALIGLGLEKDYSAFTDRLSEQGGVKVFKPNPANVRYYKELRKKYKKLYPLLREWNSGV